MNLWYEINEKNGKQNMSCASTAWFFHGHPLKTQTQQIDWYILILEDGDNDYTAKRLNCSY